MNNNNSMMNLMDINSMFKAAIGINRMTDTKEDWQKAMEKMISEAATIGLDSYDILSQDLPKVRAIIERKDETKSFLAMKQQLYMLQVIKIGSIPNTGKFSSIDEDEQTDETSSKSTSESRQRSTTDASKRRTTLTSIPNDANSTRTTIPSTKETKISDDDEGHFQSKELIASMRNQMLRWPQQWYYNYLQQILPITFLDQKAVKDLRWKKDPGSELYQFAKLQFRIKNAELVTFINKNFQKIQKLETVDRAKYLTLIDTLNDLNEQRAQVNEPQRLNSTFIRDVINFCGNEHSKIFEHTRLAITLAGDDIEDSQIFIKKSTLFIDNVFATSQVIPLQTFVVETPKFKPCSHCTNWMSEQQRANSNFQVSEVRHSAENCKYRRNHNQQQKYMPHFTQKQKEERKQEICKKCGTKGHNIKLCRRNVSVCLYCNKYKHIESMCPEKKIVELHAKKNTLANQNAHMASNITPHLQQHHNNTEHYNQQITPYYNINRPGPPSQSSFSNFQNGSGSIPGPTLGTPSRPFYQSGTTHYAGSTPTGDSSYTSFIQTGIQELFTLDDEGQVNKPVLNDKPPVVKDVYEMYGIIDAKRDPPRQPPRKIFQPITCLTNDVLLSIKELRNRIVCDEHEQYSSIQVVLQDTCVGESAIINSLDIGIVSNIHIQPTSTLNLGGRQWQFNIRVDITIHLLYGTPVMLNNAIYIPGLPVCLIPEDPLILNRKLVKMASDDKSCDKVFIDPNTNEIITKLYKTSSAHEAYGIRISPNFKQMNDEILRKLKMPETPDNMQIHAELTNDEDGAKESYATFNQIQMAIADSTTFLTVNISKSIAEHGELTDIVPIVTKEDNALVNDSTVINILQSSKIQTDCDHTEFHMKADQEALLGLFDKKDATRIDTTLNHLALSSDTEHNQKNTIEIFVQGEILSSIIHNRFGHPGVSVSRLIAKQLGPKHIEPVNKCTTCLECKATTAPINHVCDGLRPIRYGDMMYVDVFLWKSTSTRHFYFVLVIDGATSMCHIGMLNSKTNVLDNLVLMQRADFIKRSLIWKRIHGDRGELASRAIRQYFANNGTLVTFTNPDTPTMNPHAEACGGRIIKIAQCLSQEAGVPSVAGQFAIFKAHKLHDINPSVVDGKSPYERDTGLTPDYSTLRVFGCVAVMHNDNYVGSNKIDAPTNDAYNFANLGETLFNRYSFYIYNLLTNRIVIGAPVAFDETRYPFKEQRSIIIDPILPQQDCGGKVISNNQYKNDSGDLTSPFQEQPYEQAYRFVNQPVSVQNIDIIASEGRVSTPFNNTLIQPSLRPLTTHVEDEDDKACTTHDKEYYDVQSKNILDTKRVHKQTTYTSFMIGSPVLTVNEAMKLSDWNHYEEAINAELQNMTKHKVWDINKNPNARPVVKLKIILKRKSNGKYKGRLVAQGFSQVPGRDFDETYSPVVLHQSVMLLIALAAKLHLHLSNFDVEGAYLNAPLDHPLVARLPLSMGGHIVTLKKAIYGLKQAGRQWFNLIVSVLIDIGFKQSADPCLFYLWSDDDIIVIALHVDDGLVATSSISLRDRIIKELEKQFTVTHDTSTSLLFCGMEIIRTGRKIHVAQPKYNQFIVDELFGKVSVNGASSPVSAQTKIFDLSDTVTITEDKNGIPYLTHTGKFRWTREMTRHDISFLCFLLGVHQAKPNSHAWAIMKRGGRYLSATISHGVLFDPDCEVPNLISMCDASHAPTGSKSVSGMVTKFCGGVISSRTAWQPCVSLSTHASEWLALLLASKEVLSEKILLRSMSLNSTCEESTAIYCDNASAVQTADGAVRKTRYLDIANNFTRELQLRGEIIVIFISGINNYADILTKPLDGNKFDKHKAHITTTPPTI
jgi:hypothetical protein